MTNKFEKPNYKTTENIDPLLYTGIKWQNEICDKFDSKTGKCTKEKLDTILKNKYKDDGLFTSGGYNEEELKNMLKYSNYTKALCNYKKTNKTEGLYGKLPYYNQQDATIDAILNTTNKEIKEITKYINENDYSADASDNKKITNDKCKKFYGAYCEILKGNLKELLGADYDNNALNQYDTNCACYGDLLKDVAPEEFEMLIKSDKTGELKNALNNRACVLEGCNNNKFTPSQTYKECTAGAITICTNNVNIGGIDVSDGGTLGKLGITNDCTASSSVSYNDNNNNNNNNENENKNNENKDNEKEEEEEKTEDNNNYSNDDNIDNLNNNNLLLYGGVGLGACCCLICCVIISILLLKRK